MIKTKLNTYCIGKPILPTTNKQHSMRDIFIGYKTGSREWTYDRKRFSEGEFRLVFGPILPNELIHEAAAAFLAVTHLDVILFSVPMNLSHPGLQRDVVFIQQFDSQYWNMFSFLSGTRSQNSDFNRAFENAHSGALTEYDIIDLIEPTNDAHQQALIGTWFDIDNWFEILRSYDFENLDEVEDIINGRAPEQLNAGADVFVPELAPSQLQPLQIAQWSVLDLL